MLIILMFRSDLNLGHVGSKTRSLGHILEKPCVHCRGHSFDSMDMKLSQTVKVVICGKYKNLNKVIKI